MGAVTGIPVKTLRQGERLDLGAGCGVQVLWPPEGKDDLGRRDLVLLLEFDGRRILVVDPGSAGVLALLPGVWCDAIVFTGVERGAGDAAVRRAVAVRWACGCALAGGSFPYLLPVWRTFLTTILCRGRVTIFGTPVCRTPVRTPASLDLHLENCTGVRG